MAVTLAQPQTWADSCPIAYKEWAGVCCALGEGRQTILLRKGGIAESRGVFHPEHAAFWMYPTHLHESQQGIREDAHHLRRELPDGVIRLDLLAVVSSTAWVNRLEVAESLSQFHVWTEATIRTRFKYRSPGIWVQGVRVYRRLEPWDMPISAMHAGCRTWVPLDPVPATTRMMPVLSDAVAEAASEALSAALAQPIGAR